MEFLKLIKGKILLVCLVAFAVAVIAITVFRVPLGSLLYFGIFLACPLMHILMMKGHRGHDYKGKDHVQQNNKSCH